MNTQETFTRIRALDSLIKESGLNKPKVCSNLRALSESIVVSPEILKGCLKLYVQGHNALAVETAFKAINNYVKSRSGLSTLDGVPLMQTAFSPANPKIKLNKLKTISEKDEQLGYMYIFAGSMAGIRNPRAHEDDLQDSERTAFELLILADHLFRKLKNMIS
jgi:uncharacterized protein (TIGR02391 family)